MILNLILHYVIIAIVVVPIEDEIKLPKSNFKKKLEKKQSYAYLNLYEEILKIKDNTLEPILNQSKLNLNKIDYNKQYVSSSPIPIPYKKN